ncbi:Crp/Fnr family transcriptional regulator [Streptomyces sp. NPDC094038]|uniref:Crp/Fnr family transcriptional regulator n=1 Tax=Streptomyces sp. NPDC094038 TaxID=3366055 RepID=UPI0037FAFC8A
MDVPIGSGEWPARSLLGLLSPPARQDLLGLGTRARFETDAVLLREGMNDQHVLLLLSGFAKVTATVENGESSLLAVRAAGDTVGEMALLTGSPRSATVTACGPLTARVLPSRALRELLMRRPEVSMGLTALVADRLRWANQRRLDFHGYPAKVRLARLLVELAASYGSSGPGAITACPDPPQRFPGREGWNRCRQQSPPASDLGGSAGADDENRTRALSSGSDGAWAAA